ncbi:hypothetical protein VTL71DRAFT_13676 [Oculimacula yallundae]|uniref:Uncharacterized protein n=1 Tax=Oculimacula yallundae TaxID=86028 RepID=A0ABR4CL44_9HELO
MESDSHPSLSLSFLTLPSFFHASHSAKDSPATSPLSLPNHTHTDNLPSSTSSWWPIRSTSSNRYRKVEEIDEGLLSQSHDSNGTSAECGVMEDAVLARQLRRRMVWELVALGGLLVFLVATVVFCLRGGGMRMAGTILARDKEA